MANKPEPPAEDPNLAAFRAILAKKKAAKAPTTGPATGPNKTAAQKPRPKDRIRRRP